MDATTARVLVADDDPEIVRLVSAVLLETGFEVLSASEGTEAFEQAVTYKPDVILLDVMMPGLDGIEVCRRIRRHAGTSHICVMLLTALAATADKLLGLRAGADDYITKPFDPDELIERMRSALRRNRDMAALSPLTGLPGNRQIEEMVVRLLEEGSAFAVMHVDIDNFKAFNDRYGVLRGDMAIKQLARCVEVAMNGAGASRGFVGHVGGDDMMVLIDPELAEPVARAILDSWDAEVAELYDSKDALAGEIGVLDRQHRLRTYPLMTVSIGIANSATRLFANHLEATDIAAEMKQTAKGQPGSSYAIDRRTGEVSPMPPASPVPSPSAAPVGAYSSRTLLRRPGKGQMPDRLWDQLAALAEVTRSSQQGEGAKMRDQDNSVLIVDDEEDVRDILRLHCELQGFPVVAEAADGAEAVRKTIEHQPNFVILDYSMPGMDGAEAAERIRSLDPSTKIIAFSGFLTEKPDWADDFLSKEQIAQLTPLLGRFLESRTGSQQPPR